jgi:hypothetical protein
MIDRHQDPELRARFEELKRLDASRAPSFAEVMARARAEAAHGAGSRLSRVLGVKLRHLGWAGGLAAAATIAALIVIPRDHSQEDAFEQAVQAFHANPGLAGWRSPTDGLLNVPGSQLMSRIPNVGTGQQ